MPPCFIVVGDEVAETNLLHLHERRRGLLAPIVRVALDHWLSGCRRCCQDAWVLLHPNTQDVVRCSGCRLNAVDDDRECLSMAAKDVGGAQLGTPNENRRQREGKNCGF